jgi:acyl-CoA dehydrogenase
VSESGNIVAETATRIFADLADPQTINRGGDGAWKAPLWRALAEAGLTLAWVPEALGGTGAALDDGFDIIGVAGRFAAPVPLAETLLAGWLLSRAGIASPAGAMAVAPMHPDNRVTLNSDGTLSGCARSISFAREARHLAVCATAHGKTSIALVEAGACRIADGRNLAGDALDAVTFDRAKPILLACAPADFDLTSLMLMGAAVRAVATAAALESVLSLSVRYANERVAFERPIGKFQAVQHNLARLAGDLVIDDLFNFLHGMIFPVDADQIRIPQRIFADEIDKILTCFFYKFFGCLVLRDKYHTSAVFFADVTL